VFIRADARYYCPFAFRTSLIAPGDKLYVGTSKGQLLVYRVTGDAGAPKVDLIDTKKAFSKKGSLNNPLVIH
jgi:hypothetical protein